MIIYRVDTIASNPITGNLESVPVLSLFTDLENAKKYGEKLAYLYLRGETASWRESYNDGSLLMVLDKNSFLIITEEELDPPFDG